MSTRDACNEQLGDLRDLLLLSRCCLCSVYCIARQTMKNSQESLMLLTALVLIQVCLLGIVVICCSTYSMLAVDIKLSLLLNKSPFQTRDMEYCWLDQSVKVAAFCYSDSGPFSVNVPHGCIQTYPHRAGEHCGTHTQYV